MGAAAIFGVFTRAPLPISIKDKRTRATHSNLLKQTSRMATCLMLDWQHRPCRLRQTSRGRRCRSDERVTTRWRLFQCQIRRTTRCRHVRSRFGSLPNRNQGKQSLAPLRVLDDGLLKDRDWKARPWWRGQPPARGVGGRWRATYSTAALHSARSCHI